ncbi:MAG TPA: ester cyclase [Acidimicrobiales bacterium]|jgi:ketosteroid isomerase-like protein|nr:ester cyclase [Acidimicrobiales bacterium]
MSNVDTHRSAHEAFNRRDWGGVVEHFSADAEYTDQARGVTVKGPVEFVDYLQTGWIAAFSDARVTETRYTDGGDRTVTQFVGTGTNDGSLGPMPATGNKMIVPFCEILEYDAMGRVTRGELYYDQASLLSQLGHLPPLSG